MMAKLSRAASFVLTLCLLPSSAATAPPATSSALPTIPQPGSGQPLIVEQVMAVERAFAATMKSRDLALFKSYLSPEAIFFSGPGRPVLRGPEAIAGAWARFYQGATPPFSWEPERVEVIDSGSLALSTGPVRDPSGQPIATFNSIWRREADGRWRILFDKGEELCPRCEAPPKTSTGPSQLPSLEAIDAYVQAARSAWRAPGVAIAVVQGGRVLFARGYGQRELGGQAPIDAHTRFPIASLTKGFTAALLSQEVAAGKLSFDAALAPRLPGLALKDPQVTAELSLRDVLAHRSGLDESAELLWPGTGYDQAEIVARLRAVGQAAPLRTRFSYSNVLYVAAGKLLAQLTGRPFEKLVAERILQPAAMHDSGVGLPQAADDNFARPHAEEEGVLRQIAPRAVDNIAPAAALYSSAHDLARWLLLLLGRGELSGQRLLPTPAIDALLSPQMLVGLAPWQQRLYPESHLLAQGLGFMLQDYRGELVAWGTGGIDGYACSLLLLPSSGLGIVVLTNVPWTGLPEGLVFFVLDRFLGGRDRDYSALRLALSLQSRARHIEAQKEALGPRQSTTWPVPAERLIGRYHSELLGDAVITATPSGPGSSSAASLTLRIGRSLLFQLQPWRRDALRAQPIDRQLDPELCQLRSDGDGPVRGFQLTDHGAFVRVAATR